MSTAVVEARELIGEALDLAVAKAIGRTIRYDPMGFGDQPSGGYWIWGNGVDEGRMKIGAKGPLGYSPSTDWRRGGPLLGRLVSLTQGQDSNWHAIPWTEYDIIELTGPTILIAAMRAIVAAELGDDVEVPAELVEACDA